MRGTNTHCKFLHIVDPTCELKAGDHEFVEVESYIAYHHAMDFAAGELEKQIDKGILKQAATVKPDLLERICTGVSQSNQTVPSVKKYYAAQVSDDE